MILVGTILKGLCGGAFGRDSYHDKRVEAVGADWVVARRLGAAYGPEAPEFATGRDIHAKLQEFVVP